MQAIYGWKKKVTLEYYSLQIIHALFQATSLPIHQNFCSIQGWETSCYSFLFSCYCSGRIIYKKSRALQVHRQRTELQPNKRSQQSHGAAHTQLSWGRGQHVRVVNSASNKEQQGFGFHPVFSAVSADVWWVGAAPRGSRWRSDQPQAVLCKLSVPAHAEQTAGPGTPRAGQHVRDKKSPKGDRTLCPGSAPAALLQLSPSSAVPIVLLQSRGLTSSPAFLQQLESRLKYRKHDIICLLQQKID